MAAAAWDETWDAQAHVELASLRSKLGRQPGQEVHFVKLSHHDRLLAAHTLGTLVPNVTVITVTVCKRELAPMAGFTEDMAYLWTFRLLLERLSWLARDSDLDLDYTLAHVTHFRKVKLRKYEAALRHLPGCQVAWENVPRGGSLGTPNADERLQWADIAASATWQAFELQRGFTEQRYLFEMAATLYRRNMNLLSYGLKVHPHPKPNGTYGWVYQV